MSDYVGLLGIIAGLLQACGYALYIRGSLRKEIDPNAATWFMFAYGVALLTVLEWDRGANLALTILPIVCATLSVVMASICLRRGTLRWPSEWEDKWELRAFLGDISLTVLYGGAWVLYVFSFLGEEQRSLAALAFLFGSNATTFTAFAPILRGTYMHPQKERPLPWLLWSSAYVVLGVATVLEHGLWTELLIYPASNAVLHAAVAWFARPWRRRWRAIVELWLANRRRHVLHPA